MSKQNTETSSSKERKLYPFIRGWIIQLNEYDFWRNGHEPVNPAEAYFFASLDDARMTLDEIRYDEDVIFDSRQGYPKIVKIEHCVHFL